MKEGTLTFIGRDSGFGNKNNSAYFEDSKTLTLIDCGFTVFEDIKDRFDFKKYDEINIIITHLHNDHAGSLSQVILYLYFIYNKKVTVISKCERIKEYLDITGTPEDSYEIKTGTENVSFIKTEHVKYLDAYGFRININDKEIVYTGDTSTIEPFLPYIENADELYIDSSRYGGAHIKIEDNIEILNKIKEIGTEIFLMHIDDKEYIKNITKSAFNT